MTEKGRDEGSRKDRKIKSCFPLSLLSSHVTGANELLYVSKQLQKGIEATQYSKTTQCEVMDMLIILI